MVERIEKIARVKGVDYDVGRRFNSGGNHGGESDFAAELKKVLTKKTERKQSQISEAYALDITSLGGQGLFYFGATDMRALLN